jgi:phage terminase large subunit GpA-like protein
MINNFELLLKALSHELERLTVVQWAEKYRSLSKESTRFAGKLSYAINPYMKGIINSFLPDDPCEIIGLMKASQLGFTDVGIVSVIGWIISQMPASCLYITENDEKIKEQMQGVISEMIDNSGISHLIGSANLREFRESVSNRKKKGSGDTVKGFDFKDGKFYTYSGQKIGTLSTFSVKYGIYDEVERYKGSYKKAGSFLKLIEQRHKSFGSDRKLLFGSTPEVDQTSNIKPIYEMGDQRKYNIPCKKCHKMIDLQWSVEIDEKTKAGIVYKRDGLGNLIEKSVAYRCQKCGEVFTEPHLYAMYEEEAEVQKRIDAGQNNVDHACDWLPTATPKSIKYKSFQINSMYAPAGFYSWTDMARNWCDIHPINKPVYTADLQVFINQELGLTYEMRSEGVRIKNLSLNTRNYEVNSVPESLSKEDGNGGIVFITCAVDLNGNMNDDDPSEDDVRLDYEVKAWCENGDDNFVSSYTIDAGSIGTFQRANDKRTKTEEYKKNRTKWTYRHGAKNNVWDVFETEVLNKTYLTDTGRKLKIYKTGVDTGSFTVHAYEFVQKRHDCVALKGRSDLMWTKIGAKKPYYTKGAQPNLYIVDGDMVKDMLAYKIVLPWNERTKRYQPMGFMNFPLAEDGKFGQESYFKEFEGEKKEIKLNAAGEADSYRWRKKNDGSRNHFFDCAVYNEVVRIISYKEILEQLKTSEGKKVPLTWSNFTKYVRSLIKKKS